MAQKEADRLTTVNLARRVFAGADKERRYHTADAFNQFGELPSHRERDSAIEAVARRTITAPALRMAERLDYGKTTDPVMRDSFVESAMDGRHAKTSRLNRPALSGNNNDHER